MNIHDMSELLKTVLDFEAIVKIVIECENDNPEPLAKSFNKLDAYEKIKEIVIEYEEKETND